MNGTKEKKLLIYKLRQKLKDIMFETGCRVSDLEAALTSLRDSEVNPE